jgi:poly(3-hydroxybutyrate) depolymerase
MIYQPIHAIDAAKSGFRAIAGPVPREYFYHFPAGLHAASPIIVSVHGISMNAAEHMVRMRSLAEATGAAIVAPCFRKKLYPRYQQLEDSQTGIRSDLALIDILADVRRRSGIRTRKIHITGFSGGAQFAHRFAFYHADMVASCVSCSAGWYTFPDPETAYPFGIADSQGPTGMSVHADWRKVPHHVVVGSRDTAIEDALNMTAAVVEVQGVGRRTRARRWVRAMNRGRARNGLPTVTLTELRGLTHDFSAAHERHALASVIGQKMDILGHEDEIDV